MRAGAGIEALLDEREAAAAAARLRTLADAARRQGLPLLVR